LAYKGKCENEQFANGNKTFKHMYNENKHNLGHILFTQHLLGLLIVSNYHFI